MGRLLSAFEKVENLQLHLFTQMQKNKGKIIRPVREARDMEIYS